MGKFCMSSRRSKSKQKWNIIKYKRNKLTPKNRKNIPEQINEPKETQDNVIKNNRMLRKSRIQKSHILEVKTMMSKNLHVIYSLKG